MKMKLPKQPYIWLLVSLFTLLSLLLFSCSSNLPEVHEDNTNAMLYFTPLSSEMKTFVEQYDEQVNTYLTDYVEAYNRVVALSNSVFLADLSITDRSLLTRRLDAAIEETEALLDLCRAMETYAKTTFEPALEAFRLTDAYAEHQKIEKNLQTKSENTYHARRLIEMMLDSEYGTTYSMADISRRTGVGMSKLFFLLNQTNDKISTNVDIVDDEEYGKEIKYIETVRDTANTVNSTLALVNPVTAIIKGGATATAASAIGWVAKAKTTVTVIENASAVMTFTGNVVNMAVDEQDIPPSFKTAMNVNGYLGIVLGGKTGFTGSSGGEKAVAIIGAGSDITTTFFTVKEDGVQLSKTPMLETTPSSIDTAFTESAEAILPSGAYNLPDVDFGDWAYPEFDWGDDQFWEDVYDEKADLYAQMTAMQAAFDSFAQSWDPNGNNAKTKKESVDSESGLPSFLDDLMLVDSPENEDFIVTLTASVNKGLIPFSVSFTAHPNDAFVPGSMEFTWDFDDGSSESNAASSVIHEFTTSDDYFDVTVKVDDIRGFSSTATVRIEVAETLQSLIDAYGENATIQVPRGTYVEKITIPKGTSLIGAEKETTIIDGRVFLNNDSHLEGFTITTQTSQNGSGIWWVVDDVDFSEVSHYNVEIDDCMVDNGYGMDLRIPDEYNIPITGFIKNTTIKNHASTSVLIDRFSGVFQDNTVTCNTSGIHIGEASSEAIIKGNTISHTDGTGLYVGNLDGAVTENMITHNSFGVLVEELASKSVFSLNTIQENGQGMQVQTVRGLIKDNLFAGNTISQTISEDGAGLQIEYLETEGILEKNTFSNNAIQSTLNNGGGLFIYHLKGSVKDNSLTYNTNTSGAGGGAYIGQLFSGAVFSGNTITNNSSATIGGGLYIHTMGENLGGNVVTANTAATNGGGIFITNAASGFIPSPKIKDSNTISGNSLTDPINESAKKDLRSPWNDDVLPENIDP